MARTVFKLGAGVFGLVLAMVMVVGLASPSFASAYMRPTVTHVTPTSGTTLGGTTVTISGKYYTGYGKSLVKTVWFGGTWKGTNIHVLSNGLLKVTSPRGAGTVKVRVATVAGLSSVNSASVYSFVAAPPVAAAPVVTGVSPNSGSALGGDSVTITGSNLLGTTGVMFGTTPALFLTSATDGHSITAIAPAGTVGSTVNVTVTTPAGTSAVSTADQFTYAVPQTNAITAFSFSSPAATGTIDQANDTIAVTVPHGTNLSALVASFTTTGASVAVGTTTQVSGTTANDFSNPVAYTVSSANGSTQTYTVTVTVAANTAKAITSFSVLGVPCTISGTNITVTVPYNTDVTKLVPTFTTTGASVTVGGVTQVSGTTANDFSSPVTYTVTASDGSMQSYTVTVTVATNPSAKAITAFSILGNSGTISGNAIAVAVPYGTNVSSLVASFTTTGAKVTVGSPAVTQVSGTTANDFTNPVTYTVTAADGTTATYNVTVTPQLIGAKEITAFTVPNETGTTTIDQTTDTIGLTVPYGTNVSALVPTITYTGVSVSPANGVAENFTSPVTYTVTDGNGSTQNYTVTVTVAANTAKAITAFTVPSETGTTTINQTTHAIALTVPYGTDVTKLVPTFTTTGASVTVGSPAVTQVSGTTVNSFSSPVAYTVTAADGTTATYTVTVTVAANPNPSADALTAFSFQGLSPAVIGTFNGNNIAVAVPYGTNVSSLVATFTTTGASVTVGSPAATQVSGTTVNSFSSPVAYTVTAADGSTQIYTVTVTVAANPTADALTAFTVPSETGSTTIDQTTGAIALTVPYGTNVSSLVATFTTTGASVTVGGVTQVSGTTANNFSSPVTYVVHAVNGSTQIYTVTVTVAANPAAKAITAFSLLGVPGTISGNTISVTLPYNTVVTSLAPIFTTTGVKVTVGGVTQVSGTTVNSFSSPVVYTVTAADGSTQTYTVTVTVAAAT